MSERAESFLFAFEIKLDLLYRIYLSGKVNVHYNHLNLFMHAILPCCTIRPNEPR